MKTSNQKHAPDWKRKKIEFIFDEVVKELTPDKKDIASIKRVIDGLDVVGKSVLEAGCGIGDNLIYCVEKGAVYAEGFDISMESIKVARSKTGKFTNCFFNKCSIEEYDTNKKFDIIIAWGIFEYVDEPLESLKKLCARLNDNGVLLLLISKPIFIKRLSIIPRVFLSIFPMEKSLNVAKIIGKIFRVFNPILCRFLYTGESKTYSIEQTVAEGLMVPRYNIFHHRLFTEYLYKQGFSINYFYDAAPSMTCIIAKKGIS